MKQLMDNLSAEYRGSVGGAVYKGGRCGRGLADDVTSVIHNVSSWINQIPKGGYTDYNRHLAGERIFEEGHNPWLNFIHEHKGQGYSLEELSRMYYQMYSRR